MLPSDVRPASFRSVKFEAREVARSGGKHLVVESLVQRAEPWVDDLERKTRTWRIQAFIVGSDTVDADDVKRKLIEACEARGSATLVHPTEGSLTVQCEAYEVAESSDNGNVIEFALAFIEAGKPAKSSPDRKSRLKAIAARLRTANRTAQRVRRSVLDYGSKTRAILAGDVEDRAQAMLGLQSQFVGSDTSEFSGLLTSMISTADSLVTDSDDEFDAWVDAFDALDEPPDRRTLIGRLAELVQDADDYASAGGLTGSTLALAVESLASAVAVHATAVCAATDIILDDPFEVYDDAVLVLSGMLDAIDVDEPHLTDFDALAALQDLQAEILDALKEDALDLPRLRTLSLDKPTPALVLAYSLYQDAERADEIVMRNGASDPLFLSGDLLVLTE